MKFLIVGDFHGKFPKKFEKLIDKEKIDLVVSLGDFPPFAYRKLWFKHCYGKDKELWEVIGKKKYNQLVKKDLSKAEKVLKILNGLPIPVYTTLGNVDWPPPNDIFDVSKKMERSMPNYQRKDTLANRIKKYSNIKRIDYKAARLGEYVFLGMRGHSHPGMVKSKAFKKHKKILERLFKKFKKENKKIIFVSHIAPYQTKLDKIGKKAHKRVRGKHFGSKLAKRIIKQQKPLLAFGGHIHESAGKDKIGKSIVINPGSVYEGKGVIVDLTKGKINKIKFIK